MVNCIAVRYDAALAQNIPNYFKDFQVILLSGSMRGELQSTAK